MVLNFRTPGIYSKDIFPVEPVGLVTGVPVFLGCFRREKLEALLPQLHLEPLATPGLWLVRTKSTGKPEPGISGMFTLWSEFEAKFGPLRPESYLVQAVRGFFENGGSRCYIQILAYEAAWSISQALTAGLQLLEPLEKADLLCAPDFVAGDRDTVALQKMVLEHCDRLADRFAILDSLPGAAPEQVLRQRESLTGINGALYYPWVRPVEATKTGHDLIPPCGHVAGVFARSDRAIGVHKAPANEILEGVLDLEINLTSSQQDGLNPEGVNCIRAFPGRGILIWGARTLSREVEWTYVNVRRLFLTIGRWIERNLQWAALEPNDQRLWSRIDRELSAYFTSLHREGALKGRSAPEAFYVNCNSETNPPEVRAAGMVVTDIGLALTAPAEFIVVQIIHGTSGVTVTTTSTTSPSPE